MRADDERHGTITGYTRGCRQDCCRAARMRHEKRRRMDADRGITYTVDATGTRRRIQALMRLGWRSADIAERCGWATPYAVDILLKRERVNRRTAATIAEVYGPLSMQLGPSNITRGRAEKSGYAPPLAWDDIDKDERPNYGTAKDYRKTWVDHARIERRANGDRSVWLNRLEAAEVVRRLLRHGHTTTWIEDNIGLTPSDYGSVEELRGERGAA